MSLSLLFIIVGFFGGGFLFYRLWKKAGYDYSVEMNDLKKIKKVKQTIEKLIGE